LSEIFRLGGDLGSATNPISNARAYTEYTALTVF